jgi:hypothetical protein
MGDFPWEVIKAETLRLIARDLGIKRSLKRDETIAFLRSVQKRGCMLPSLISTSIILTEAKLKFWRNFDLEVGPALVNEISKDLGRSTSRQDDEDDTSSPAPPTPPSPPSTRTRPKPRTPASRRTTSRKRPAQEMEPSSLADNEDEDEDAEGEIDVEMDIEPASISAIGRNARPRSNKRLRLSDPGPAPARNTRSKGAAQTSVSAMTLRSSPRRGSSARRTVHTHDQRYASKKRTSRKSRKQAPVEEEGEEGEGGEDADADADAEGEDDIESEEEIEKISTGPDALAAVLTRASIQSKTPRSRGRPRKGSQKQNRVSKSKPSRPRPQPSVTSQPQSGPSTDINVDSPRSKRTIKPTFKVSLLGQLKRPTSILSRPVRSPGGQALQRGGVILSRVRFGVDGMSEGPKEVFDGVVLNKRIVRGADRGLINGVVDNRNRGLQLDEFVANGIERQNALENRNDDRMVTSDPVLDREDVSTLGGSNKGDRFGGSLGL